MSVTTASRCGAVRILEVDPELADTLPPGERAAAVQALVVPGVAVRRGEWRPGPGGESGDGRLGMLLVSGLMTREVAVDDTVSAELLGPGDLIRPWDVAPEALVPCDVRWRVIEETRLALLGLPFAQAAARWPMLTGALVARAVRRSHALALAGAITCTTGLEIRLSLLFWSLADRWGKVTPDGIVVPVRLTHETIARLVGARRPSISTALKQLERDGRLIRLHAGGWLLTGDPVERDGVVHAA